MQGNQLIWGKVNVPKHRRFYQFASTNLHQAKFDIFQMGSKKNDDWRRNVYLCKLYAYLLGFFQKLWKYYKETQNSDRKQWVGKITWKGIDSGTKGWFS